MNWTQKKQWLPNPGVQVFNENINGRMRKTIVYTPSWLKEGSYKAPLVFVLHGDGGNATEMRETTTQKQFEEMAEKLGFVVAYPEAVLEPRTTGGHWNDGRNLDYESHRNNVDDVKFFETLISTALNDYRGFEPGGIYVMGVSNGGMMAQRLACNIGGQLAGVVSVVGALPKNIVSECEKGVPTPIMFMMGTDDPLMQWDSGYVHDLKGEPTLGERLTVPDTLGFWLDKNGCRAEGMVTKFADTNKKDKSTIWSENFPCKSGQSVLMYTVEGGGHTYPGVDRKSKTSGNVNMDIRATDEIILFGRDYSRNLQPTYHFEGVDVWENRVIGGEFAHKADFLIPENMDENTRAIVMLHGGGGTKVQFANALGIKNTADDSYKSGINSKFLKDNNIALIFVQGFAIPEKKDSFTWSNLIMTSGQDDKAMLTFLSKSLRSIGFSKVFLMGHSMGGAMTNRMWCEGSESYDGFGSSAGPMSPTLWNSCKPKVMKPYVHITGVNDRIIQLIEEARSGKQTNHLNDEFLNLDSMTRTMGGRAFVHAAPEFKNELVSYKDRVKKFCGKAVSAEVMAPNNKDWKTKTQNDCDGKLRMVQIRNADHCTGGSEASGGYKCDIPLNPIGTQEYLKRFVDFFKTAAK